MLAEFSRLLLPLIVLLVVLALFIAAALFSRNYIKVPPNAVAVFSGRKHKLADGRMVGYRMVRGRGVTVPCSSRWITCRST